MLKLKLFGSGEASFYDHPLEGFPYQQAFLLLCYLLLNKGRLHPRERLAAVFWGDYPNLTARKYLRNTLYRLRHGLDSIGADSSQYLQITEESIAFIITSQYWLDIECFETITSHYQHYKPENLLPEQAIELGKCVDLYTGDLLESVYEDWCLHDRERLRLAYLDVLGKLMVFSFTQGDHEQGIDYGERILALDPTRENVHRQMMMLHWLAGDRPAALSQYKRCSQILQEEMGIQPMGATLLLYEKMLHNQFEPGSIPVNEKISSSNETPVYFTAADLEIILTRLSKLQEDAVQVTNEILQLQGLINLMLSQQRP